MRRRAKLRAAPTQMERDYPQLARLARSKRRWATLQGFAAFLARERVYLVRGLATSTGALPLILRFLGIDPAALAAEQKRFHAEVKARREKEAAS